MHLSKPNMLKRHLQVWCCCLGIFTFIWADAHAQSCDPANAPGNLSVDNVQTTSALLQWDCLSGGFSYQLMGGKTGAPGVVTLNLPPAGCTDSYNVSGLDINTEYWWQVRAICDASGSPTSAWS
jgi:hypothetical protein